MPSSTSQTVKNINISQQSAQQQQQPPPHVVDFFSAQAGSIGKASEDLLQLNNPFADVYNIQPNNQINPVANAWINNGNNGKLIQKEFSTRFSETCSTVINDFLFCVTEVLIYNLKKIPLMYAMNF